jgi:hypothetical protein
MPGAGPNKSARICAEGVCFLLKIAAIHSLLLEEGSDSMHGRCAMSLSLSHLTSHIIQLDSHSHITHSLTHSLTHSPTALLSTHP